jgi:hypothetical protein
MLLENQESNIFVLHPKSVEETRQRISRPIHSVRLELLAPTVRDDSNYLRAEYVSPKDKGTPGRSPHQPLLTEDIM